MKNLLFKKDILISLIFFIIALVVFLIGIAFYYYFRQPTIVGVFLNIDHPTVILPYINYFNWFPSFAHVFSFSIFTWLILEKQYENYAIGIWVLLNLLMEFAQLMSQPIDGIPYSLQKFFVYGTFSIWDVVAIWMAAGCVKLVIKKARRVKLS